MSTSIRRSMSRSMAQMSMSLCSIPTTTVSNSNKGSTIPWIAWKVEEHVNCERRSSRKQLKRPWNPFSTQLLHLCFPQIYSRCWLQEKCAIPGYKRLWGFFLLHSGADFNIVFARGADWSRTLRVCESAAKPSHPWITEGDTSNGHKERSGPVLLSQLIWPHPSSIAGPVVTDNGNFVIDAPFEKEMLDPFMASGVRVKSWLYWPSSERLWHRSKCWLALSRSACFARWLVPHISEIL